MKIVPLGGECKVEVVAAHMQPVWALVRGPYKPVHQVVKQRHAAVGVPLERTKKNSKKWCHPVGDQAKCAGHMPHTNVHTDTDTQTQTHTHHS